MIVARRPELSLRGYLSGLLRYSRIQLGGRALTEQELVHLIGAPGEPAFANGWANQSGKQDVGFWKTNEGWVHLTGVPWNAFANRTATMFILPVGYRPPAEVPWIEATVPWYQQAAATEIGGAIMFIGGETHAFPGYVRVLNYEDEPASGARRVCLDGIRFRAF